MTRAGAFAISLLLAGCAAGLTDMGLVRRPDGSLLHGVRMTTGTADGGVVTGAILSVCSDGYYDPGTGAPTGDIACGDPRIYVKGGPSIANSLTDLAHTAIAGGAAVGAAAVLRPTRVNQTDNSSVTQGGAVSGSESASTGGAGGAGGASKSISKARGGDGGRGGAGGRGGNAEGGISQATSESASRGGSARSESASESDSTSIADAQARNKSRATQTQRIYPKTHDHRRR